MKIEDLYQDTKLVHHLQDPKTSKCRLNAMRFLKIFLEQHRDMQIDSFWRFFNHHNYSSFKSWFGEQKTVKHVQIRSKALHFHELVHENSFRLDNKKVLRFLELNVDRVNENIMIVDRDKKVITMNLLIDEKHKDKYIETVVNFSWSSNIMELIHHKERKLKNNSHKYISLIRLSKEFQKEEQTRLINKSQDIVLKKSVKPRTSMLNMSNHKNFKKWKHFTSSFTDLTTLEREIGQTKKIYSEYPKNKNSKKVSKSHTPTQIDPLSNLSEKDELKSDEIVSLHNNIASQSYISVPKPEIDKKFEPSKKYVINSMHLYSTLQEESSREVFIIIPMEDEKKINKTYVLQKSKLLLEYFQKKDKSENSLSNGMDNINFLNSNRSLINYQKNAEKQISSNQLIMTGKKAEQIFSVKNPFLQKSMKKIVPCILKSNAEKKNQEDPVININKRTRNRRKTSGGVLFQGRLLRNSLLTDSISSNLR